MQNDLFYAEYPHKTPNSSPEARKTLTVYHGSIFLSRTSYEPVSIENHFSEVGVVLSLTVSIFASIFADL